MILFYTQLTTVHGRRYVCVGSKRQYCKSKETDKQQSEPFFFMGCLRRNFDKSGFLGRFDLRYLEEKNSKPKSFLRVLLYHVVHTSRSITSKVAAMISALSPIMEEFPIVTNTY